MRKAVVFICIISGMTYLQAQSADRELLSATGGSFLGGFSADWSLGNLVTETGGSGNVLVTQGFQQPLVVGSTNSLQTVANSPVAIMPNPSGSDAVLNWDNMPNDASVVVYNTAGARVYLAKWHSGQSHILPGKEWASGVYQIVVVCEGKSHLIKFVRS
jgi:hypothetical protein